MAIHTTDGIVLRKQNLRETSVIITLYTKDFGKVAGIIKGVRGPKAAIGNNPHIFSLNTIVFYEKKRSNLNHISQCDMLKYFEAIRNDFEKTIYADYFIELIDTVTVEGDPDRNIYDLLLNSLELLSGAASPKRVARIFEIKLMDLVGLMPEFKECVECESGVTGEARFSLRLGALLCPKCRFKDPGAIKLSNGTINFIERVKKSPYELVSRIKVSGDVGKELEVFMRSFVDYRLQRKLKTMEFLKKVKI